jgi:hypothetical protein
LTKDGCNLNLLPEDWWPPALRRPMVAELRLAR